MQFPSPTPKHIPDVNSYLRFLCKNNGRQGERRLRIVQDLCLEIFDCERASKIATFLSIWGYRCCANISAQGSECCFERRFTPMPCLWKALRDSSIANQALNQCKQTAPAWKWPNRSVILEVDARKYWRLRHNINSGNRGLRFEGKSICIAKRLWSPSVGTSMYNA